MDGLLKRVAKPCSVSVPMSELSHFELYVFSRFAAANRHRPQLLRSRIERVQFVACYGNPFRLLEAFEHRGNTAVDSDYSVFAGFSHEAGAVAGSRDGGRTVQPARDHLQLILRPDRDHAPAPVFRRDQGTARRPRHSERRV